MPLYDYRCSACGHVVEVRHGFDETYSEPCPVCGATLQRVFNPAPIVFKGSGFYVTDSRKSSAPAEKPSEPAKTGSPSGDATSTAKAPASPPKSEKKSDNAGEPAA